MAELSPESLQHCESALAYVEDMSLWYDEEEEGSPKLDFALKILHQIDKRSDLTAAERAWVEARIRERYGTTE